MALPKKSSYLMGGTYNSAPFILADGDLSPFQLDVNGNLRVTVTGGSSSNPAAGPTGSPVPADASYTGINIGGTLFGLTGFNLTNSVPAAVAIVDGSGNQITSFGGGVQFADNAVSGATPTGTLSMGWDSANSKIRALKVDSSQNLLVDVSNATLAVTQSTSPWVISFTAPQHVIVDSGSVSISGAVSVTQGTSPWIVAGVITPADSFANPTDAQDVFALNAGWDVTNGKWQRLQVDTGTGTLKVDPGTVTVTGTVGVTQSTSPWVISFTAPQHVIVDSGAITVSGSVSISGTVGVTQSTSPWVISFTAPQHVIVDSGTLSVTQGTSPWVVSLASTTITGTVSVTQGTSPWVTEDLADGSVSGGTAGTFSLLTGGIFNTVAPVLTNGQQAALQLTASGALIVSTGGSGGGTSAVDESLFILGSSSQTPVGGVFLGGSNVPTVLLSQTGALQITADRKLVVFDPQNVLILDLLQTLISESRATRSAIVYMITENGDVRDSDFDPSNQDFQPIN
jgi:hypothetical protein